MTRAIAARRQGDEYQARIFWTHLLDLRTGDLVESVCLESDQISFVDDVVVKYREPLCDQGTGRMISCDYFQCKCHVTHGGAFKHTNLIDPSFINCKSESMLKRLHNAYLKLSGKAEKFRLYIVSNWDWHPDDEISKHVSGEMIRNTFYEGGPKSRTGSIRSKFTSHLSTGEEELRSFLGTVRFRLGKTLEDITRELELLLRLASLQPIDRTSANIIYDDLAWKLFAQGRNHFDRRSFDEMIKQEKLVVLPSPDYSEIAICSFPQEARRPHDVQAAYLDLSELFEGRFPRTESYWEKEIPSRVVSFLKSDSVRSLPPPIHLFFDCHLSIAFLAGNLLNPKFGIQVIPAQKTRTSGYEFWPEPRSSRSGLWHSKIVGTFNTEAVAAISVTNPIENHLLPFLQEAGLNHLPRVELHPVGGIGPRAVADGEHAWQLGFELQTLLRSHLPATCHTIHLFFSAPAALAYIFGNTLRHVTNTIKLYEHDFERSRGELAYYGSLQLPIKEETLM